MTLTSMSHQEIIAALRAKNGTPEPIGKTQSLDLMRAFAGCDYDILRVKAIQGIRTLAPNADDERLESLIAALRDDDEDVRVDAAETLGLLKVTRASENLLENLIHDPCGDVKLAAINALAALDARDAAPVMRQLVNGRGDEVVWDEDEIYRDEWDGWLDIQIAAIKALGQFQDKEAVEPIMLAMHDPEGQDVDIYGLEALAAIGKAALPSLAVCAKSSKRLRRYHTIRVVTSLSDEAALPMLQEALDDKDNDIRLLAFEALLKRKPSVELFSRALEDNNELVRIAAFGRLNLDEAGYLQQALSDPSPKVQLALIKRLEKTPIENKDELVYRALSLMSESDRVEVAANALGVLAAKAPKFVKNELKDLFTLSDGNPDDREQRQWAVVDHLAQSHAVECLDWLEAACSSHSRSVRLKALTTLGQLARKDDLPLANRLKGLSLLKAYAMSGLEEPEQDALETKSDEAEAGGENSESIEATEEDIVELSNEQKQAQQDLIAMREAGLDLGDEKDQSEGPTSSLGAILGHEAIAQDLIEQAEAENAQPDLSMNEQALLNQARRNLSRRKISLDGDAEQMDRELCLTAIHLLGDHPAASDCLLDLAVSTDPDLVAASLDSLARLMPLEASVGEPAADVTEEEQGLSQTDRLVEALVPTLSTSHIGTRLQALRLVAQLDRQDPRLMDLASSALKDGEARLRSEAMKPYLAQGGDVSMLVPMLDDEASLVRQASMRLLARVAPHLAVGRIVSFLLANPEQTLSGLLGGLGSDGLAQDSRAELASALIDILADEENKAAWTIAIPAMADLFAADQA